MSNKLLKFVTDCSLDMRAISMLPWSCCQAEKSPGCDLQSHGSLGSWRSVAEEMNLKNSSCENLLGSVEPTSARAG